MDEASNRVEQTTKTEAMNVETGRLNSQDYDRVVNSAHTIGQDSWKQVGLMLILSFNCGYVLSFSNLMLVPLGWGWGISCLMLLGLFTWYANWLLAEFHIIEGQRFIRYRDLMGFIFGRRMYYVTWVLQFLTLLLGNMGFILLGGRALKEINSEFSDTPLRLQVSILITGATCIVFAFSVPTMSAMKSWLAVSAFFTFAFIAILLGVLAKDGRNNTERNYKISGDRVEKVFNAFGALAAIVVCNTSGLLPEIQSTIRKPAISNMRNALIMQYSVGLLFYYGVSIVGYWAYGSSVSEYLPKELSGPKWAKITINASVFLQTIISQHMFISPVHEALDTKYLKLDQSMHSRDNIKRLLILRSILFSVNTFVTAMFPFMGDFVSLFGSFSLIPLTFVFPSMIFIKIKRKAAKPGEMALHWTITFVFSLLAMATTVAAIRTIIHNAAMYHLFADT